MKENFKNYNNTFNRENNNKRIDCVGNFPLMLARSRCSHSDQKKRPAYESAKLKKEKKPKHNKAMASHYYIRWLFFL
jgi:hypothetical protein